MPDKSVHTVASSMPIRQHQEYLNHLLRGNGNDAVVIEVRRKVYDTLDVIGSRVMEEMAVELEGHGLIKRERHYAYCNCRRSASFVS